MDALSLPTPAVDLPGGQVQAGLTAADLAKRGHIATTAQDFETSFLSTMLQTMFEGVDDAAAPFGGGEAGQMWKSFMAGAMAKQMVKAGGVGISRTVAAEMMRMQGLVPAESGQPGPRAGARAVSAYRRAAARPGQ